jgi:hypothetical protein
LGRGGIARRVRPPRTQAHLALRRRAETARAPLGGSRADRAGLFLQEPRQLAAASPLEEGSRRHAPRLPRPSP